MPLVSGPPRPRGTGDRGTRNRNAPTIYTSDLVDLNNTPHEHLIALADALNEDAGTVFPARRRWLAIQGLRALTMGIGTPSSAYVKRLSDIGSLVGALEFDDDPREGKPHIDTEWFGLPGKNWWQGKIDGPAAEKQIAEQLLEYLLQSIGRSGAPAVPWAGGAPEWPPGLHNAFDVVLQWHYGHDTSVRGVIKGQTFEFRTPLAQ